MTWKPDIFIYHSPCDDGFGAAWEVHQCWGSEVEYWPATYGKSAPDVAGKNVLIGDFSYKRTVLDQLAQSAASIIILDHHKTAAEDLAPFNLGWAGDFPFCHRDVPDVLRDLHSLDRPPVAALFDMDQSGARLVWEFCHPGLPAPDLIRYVEDRDLWRFALPETKAFSLYLRAHPYDFDTWTRLATQLADDDQRSAVMLQATAIEAFYKQKTAEMVTTAQFKPINGITVPVVNCSWAFASDVAHELLERYPDAPFAACYYDRADGSRTYSLRSLDDRQDVSAIAKRYGGGGHRNAAGFEVPAP
ncbi:hypothetical protein [Sphingomonas sp. LaA6.9]|uniref:hypothetical protein n=1 Tax=Sphingomonas sp. LaA6.9 TaxID=2919914 RepID=UPI001F503B24|nr:hypothetical protein [Sphingomonas sp. LaA6.9]MCJ8158819.1 hypothetical protein [Sphingomonas sp. LaA6.9]